MVYIREGRLSTGKVLATLNGNCVKEGGNLSGHVLVNFEGKLIREGLGFNGEVLANLHEYFIKEGKNNKGKIIAEIVGDEINSIDLEEKPCFKIEGIASNIEKAALAVAALMLRGQI